MRGRLLCDGAECLTDDQINWGPLSDDMLTGMPKRVIKWETRAWEQTEVAVSLREMASGQQEK